MTAFFSFPGVNGVNITTPTTPDLTIVGDLDLSVLILPDSWADSAARTVAGLLQTNTGYHLHRQFGQNYGRYGNGTVTRSIQGAAPLSPTELSEIRYTIVAASGFSQLYQDGAPYNSETDPSGDGVAPIPVVFGVGFDPGALAPFFGDIASVVVRDGIDGPAVLNFNASESGFADGPVADTSTWVDSDGRTWTVNGTGITYTGPGAANAPSMRFFRSGQKRIFNQDIAVIRPRA